MINLSPAKRLLPCPRTPGVYEWARQMQTDALLLFRYSALTFKGHRIHYDRPYATEVKGYPGLLVRGPLIATLMLDMLRRNMPDLSSRTLHFAP